MEININFESGGLKSIKIELSDEYLARFDVLSPEEREKIVNSMSVLAKKLFTSLGHQVGGAMLVPALFPLSVELMADALAKSAQQQIIHLELAEDIAEALHMLDETPPSNDTKGGSQA
ncbi:hypothetical protein C5B42_02535 [Candidatus Cerribacteria bacterium 'Amazon FNV 2010 28 9']|uniref:Uncharacterized protein n=1 Tax=Candidatus Cerribacteria bacterium 'Amazon FNV 2010 28 9' TaxID=2081795 RepID=A0A317JT29_9BACT|nr:MAG: hypothetical protein C5B42_02535 [Candidatus Cerribacteria bacterium 'Amazon FNV 2010 28 9']